MKKEVRTAKTQFDVTGAENPVLEGYALKFNTDSVNLGSFVETLSRDCLANADMSNVVALINHDSNLPLGRTGVNLELNVDDVGLKFRVTPTNTSYAKDLMENIKKGVVNQCSFAFTLADAEGADEWQEQEDGLYKRTIHKIGKLYDVSIVTSPAYEDTNVSVGQRSLEAVQRKKLSLFMETL